MKNKELKLIGKLLEKSKELGWNYDYHVDYEDKNAFLTFDKTELPDKTVTFSIKSITNAESFLIDIPLIPWTDDKDVGFCCGIIPEALDWAKEEVENLYTTLMHYYYDELINSEKLKTDKVVTLGFVGITRDRFKEIKDTMDVVLSSNFDSNYWHEKRTLELVYLNGSSEYAELPKLDGILYPSFYCDVPIEFAFNVGCYPILCKSLTELEYRSNVKNWSSFCKELKNIAMSIKSMSDKNIVNRVKQEGLSYALLYWRIDYYQCISMNIGRSIYNAIAPLEDLNLLLKTKSKEFFT